MKLRVKNLDIEVGGKPIALLNRDDAAELGLHTADRLNLVSGRKEFFAIVDITERVVGRGELGLFSELFAGVNLKKLSQNWSVNFQKCSRFHLTLSAGSGEGFPKSSNPKKEKINTSWTFAPSMKKRRKYCLGNASGVMA